MQVADGTRLFHQLIEILKTMTKNFYYLAIALIAMSIPQKSWADIWQDPETKVNYEYAVVGNTASVIGSPDATGDINIISQFAVNGKEYIVNNVGNHAFLNCTNLISVTIPRSVNSIGEYNQEIKGETNVEIIPVSA